jgi:hypothetical protein
MTSGAGFSWSAPAGRGRQWIVINLDHPVNPWEHEGAGSISWGAHLDRSAPLGEEAVSIIQAAWERRGGNVHDQAQSEDKGSVPVDRVPPTGGSVRPGWADRIERDHYWVHLTLHQPINERWEEEEGENWSRGELVNDGVVERSVTVEATTLLGRRALRIVEALHSAHPINESDAPERDDWYG